MMPLPSCTGQHDWSLPFRERTVAESGRIIRLKRIKECLACGKKVEAFDEPHINYPARERIQSYEV